MTLDVYLQVAAWSLLPLAGAPLFFGVMDLLDSRATWSTEELRKRDAIVGSRLVLGGLFAGPVAAVLWPLVVVGIVVAVLVLLGRTALQSTKGLDV